MYSLRYGTVPIVHNVGGLADTVVDSTPQNISDATATGIVFYESTAAALNDAVQRALDLFQQPAVWKKIMLAGMDQNLGWGTSAKKYIDLYEALIEEKLA